MYIYIHIIFNLYSIILYLHVPSPTQNPLKSNQDQSPDELLKVIIWLPSTFAYNLPGLSMNQTIHNMGWVGMFLCSCKDLQDKNPMQNFPIFLTRAPWFRFVGWSWGAHFFPREPWRCWRMINLFIHHWDSEKIDWKGRICTNMAIQNTSSLKSLWRLPNSSQVPGYINYLTALYKWRHLPFSPRNS